MKIAILGGGLTGLELGRKIYELSDDFIVFEKEDTIGGLCRTNNTNGYRWDFGVHAVYSRNNSVMNYLKGLPVDYAFLDRNVKIFHTGSDKKQHTLDYPFEIGIKDLPLRDKWQCIRGYLSIKPKKNKKYNSLEEWINEYLGNGIARHFMTPYNTKIWSSPLSEISSKLVRERIEPASPFDIIMAVLGRKVIGREHQARFMYPKKGIQALVNYIAKDIKDKIMVGTAVDALERVDGKWHIITDSGRRHTADTVISTIPLPELLQKIKVKGINKEYNVFRWNNTYFVMVALKEKSDINVIGKCHWVFFKEEEIFYRITLLHNFSDTFSPIIVAEITQRGNNRTMGHDKIVRQVIDDLVRLKIVVSEEKISETDIKLLPYTYPIPTVGLEEEKEKIRHSLERESLFLLGRSGNWDYLNMDGVIWHVKQFVEKYGAEILKGSP